MKNQLTTKEQKFLVEWFSESRNYELFDNDLGKSETQEGSDQLYATLIGIKNDY